MPSNYSSLTVTWYDESDTYVTNADITSDITSIPLFTDAGTGEVNEATIILRALDGKYITSGNIIDKRDRIHIEVTDLGGNSYDRYFEIISFVPTQNKSSGGTLLTIECLGIEYHTQHIHFTKPYYFENGYAVASDIGAIYGENKGSEQPTLSNHNTVWNNTIGNDLPDWTYNNYDYGLNEDTIYNRWMDLVDKFGASVSAGGALTFYELSFSATDKNAIRLRLRQSGDNTSFVTIKNAKVTNPKTVSDQAGQVQMETGTNLLSWGSPDHGSLPVEFSRYDSQLIQFAFRPEYDSSVSYPVDAMVKVIQSNGRSKHYKSRLASNQGNTPPSSGDSVYWERRDMAEEFGDNIQYSPWTDDKSAVWANAGADPDNNNEGRMMWDHNLVIWDENFFRTWVDVRASTNSQLDTFADSGAGNEGYSYDLTRDNFPRGFRVLVINNSTSYSSHAASSSATGDLSGFTNHVIEWNGSKWLTKYSFDSSNDQVQVAVIDEARIYEGTSFGTTATWKDISDTAYANDCFHPFVSISNVAGVDLVNGTARSAITDSTTYPDITQSGGTFAKNVNSALKFNFTWGSIATTVADCQSPTGDYYKRGAWACFRLPYPNCTYNGLTEGVGGLYGGGSTDRNTPATKFEPATIDIQNSHLTHDGLRGFNQGSSSEDLGQISAVAFFTKLEKVSGPDFDANHRMRCFMIDTSDNIVYSDYEIEFSNHWQDVRLPISSFRVYRGRRPADGLERAFTVIPPKDLEIINIFEWRNVKFMGIEWLTPYDKFGRYNPSASILDDENLTVTLETIAGGEVNLYLDAFRFIKPLLVTSGQDTTINLEPVFVQRPDITVYDQLLNDVKSQLEIEKFQHKEYNLETSGEDVFDIDFGDAFLYENDNIVYLASPETDETTNKIKLVAKRIEYSITKPQQGSGGLKRRVKGVKIFT